MDSLTFAVRVSAEKTRHVRIDVLDLDKVAMEYINFVARDSAGKMGRV